jgi:hypothetical protein
MPTTLNLEVTGVTTGEGRNPTFIVLPTCRWSSPARTKPTTTSSALSGRRARPERIRGVSTAAAPRTTAGMKSVASDARPTRTVEAVTSGTCCTSDGPMPPWGK